MHSDGHLNSFDCFVDMLLWFVELITISCRMTLLRYSRTNALY